MEYEIATYADYHRWVRSTGLKPSRTEFKALSTSDLQGIRDTIIRWDKAKGEVR